MIGLAVPPVLGAAPVSGWLGASATWVGVLAGLLLGGRSVRKLITFSGRAVVLPQQSAQPFAATNIGAPERAGLGRNQLVGKPLVIPLPVVVRHELVARAEQPMLPEQDQAVVTLRPRERWHSALGRASRPRGPPSHQRCFGILQSTCRPGHG
jgi:hypothetical protein